MGLKELRIEHKLTQKQVAEIIGVNVGTYRKYENVNVGKMRASKIAKLMEYYDVKSDSILGEDFLNKIHNKK